MTHRRRLMSQSFSGTLKPLVIYENGVINPDVGSLSNTVINGLEQDNRSMNPSYIDNSSGKTGIYLGVASPYGGNQYAFSGAITENKITIPEGYTSVNVLMRGRSQAGNNLAGAGVNLWSESGVYNQNNLFPINDTFIDYSALTQSGQLIELSETATDLGLKQSTYTADGWVAGDPGIINAHIKNAGAIPAGDYYIGAYVRIRTSAYSSTMYGHGFIERIWLE